MIDCTQTQKKQTDKASKPSHFNAKHYIGLLSLLPSVGHEY